MRSWAPGLILALLATAPALADEPPVMVLEGDVAALYANGDFVVWNPKAGGGRGSMMVAATPVGKPGDKPPSIESTLDVVAKAPIGSDGKFRLEAVADNPRRVYFYVLNAVSPQGHRMAPVKGNAFILEPGDLTLTMSKRGRFVVEGGKYNDAVYNTWRLSDEYKAAEADQARLYTPVDGESEQDKRRRLDMAAEAQQRVLTLESEGRARIATTHPEAIVRRLTIETTWLSGPWMLDALRGLAELTPEDPWVLERLAAAEAGAAKRAEERKRFAIGQDIRDFTADTLEGDAVRLADVRADSRLVLLEFWASWCGPCRVEIPHMKEAYDRYREKGFEIVSFTIDDDREAWEEASAEEGLPWINLGMGPEAEAPVAYNVTGVPKNYLVDSRTGDIVAKDLRGHKLDEKLEELLN
ncbi:MAG: TlpA disulfide reductase family protein [Gammaproteobacteria bacterium]|nr:TlpA disulfide reductase family protein [Gammaproteobacteria bacterium]